ncbi:MAG: FHA domain-containing protein [Polyangiaceae bacterium]|nr:FHA domain-containing protein [Polyangiaceae bacterium]
MGFFSRVGEIFAGRRRAGLSRARRLEALGNLEEATVLDLELGEAAEAARVIALRASAALDPEKKRVLLSQAAGLATGPALREIEATRARLTLELSAAGKYDPGRGELLEVAQRLERVGEHELAAEVYARVGDRDAQARMLVEAGAIDRLEAVLDSEHARERAERERAALHARVRDLALAGARREALALGLEARPHDPMIADVLRGVEARRPVLPRVRLVVEGERLDVVFGREVSVGRAEAALSIASPALSRSHLALRRGTLGPEAVDLGSRNGTFVAGARLDAPLRVGEGVVLELGGEVRLELAPWRGGLRASWAAGVVHAPLGPLELDGWTVDVSDDGWLVLSARSPAVLDELAVQGEIQLLTGDRLRRSPGGAVVLEVVA